MRIATTLGAALCLFAATVAVGAAATSGTAAAGCPVTKANGRVPAGAPTSFYGNGRLATFAYRVIEATERTLNRDGSVSEKFPWWGSPTLRGTLRIVGTRIGTRTPRLRATIHEGGAEGAPPGTRFWASGITFPRPGCWRIVGRVGDVHLTVVVLVKKPRSGWARADLIQSWPSRFRSLRPAPRARGAKVRPVRE